MIALLDNLIRELLLQQVPGIDDASQIGFQPPDGIWRSRVANLAVGGDPVNALNVFLFDLRENRSLRTNARLRTYEDGMVRDEPAPALLDCHYLISAWSPAEVTVPIEPTLDEHELIYDTTAVLMRNVPFNPSRVYPSGSAALTDWPERWRAADLDAHVAPVEGYPKLAEFWSGMGDPGRWRPALYLVATLPVFLRYTIAGPPVTTLTAEFRANYSPRDADSVLLIGGTLREPGGDPVPGAWVRLETISGVALITTSTDADGRYVAGPVRAGRYQVRFRAPGQAAGLRPDVEVPSPTGEYDLQF